MLIKKKLSKLSLTVLGVFFLFNCNETPHLLCVCIQCCRGEGGEIFLCSISAVAHFNELIKS